MRFLCPRHRQLLRQHPDLAEQNWEEWMRQGLHAMTAENWSRAASYYGCSYEVCEGQLRSCRRESLSSRLVLADRVMVAGHLLAECLGRNGDLTNERHYLIAVHAHLVELWEDCGDTDREGLRKNIELSLMMLKRHCQRYGEFGGLDACLHQARGLLETSRPAAGVH